MCVYVYVYLSLRGKYAAPCTIPRPTAECSGVESSVGSPSHLDDHVRFDAPDGRGDARVVMSHLEDGATSFLGSLSGVA
jgi:hypothetical protein